MDPIMKSLLSSVVKDALTGAGTLLVAHGYLSADAESQFINSLVGIVLVAVSQGLTWYKSRMLTETAVIAQVNKQDNGVTVVPTAAAAAAGVPTVNAPLK